MVDSVDAGTVPSPAPVAPAVSPRGRLRRATPRSRDRAAEHLAVLVLALGVLVVHDVHYLLRQPFWTDEAWVAVTTRYPLTDLPRLTSSTPIGWSLLLRLDPIGGQQGLRLVPLAFAGGAVAAAYWLGRGLGWADRRFAVVAGTLAALGVLLLPAMLIRDDLKQYTADACMALVVLALLSRTERDWTRRNLAWLGLGVAGGMLVSHTVAFVGVAVFVSLVAVQVVRRSWRAAIEAAATGAATAVGMLAVYLAFDARAVVPGLTAFWQAYYVPLGRGVRPTVDYLRGQWDGNHLLLGLGQAWVALPLLLAGVLGVMRLGRPATAATLVVILPEMIVLSALKKYPFLDQRTGTFLFAIAIVVAAIGVATICAGLRRWLTLAGATALALAAAVLFAVHVGPFVRTQQLPVEDMPTQVAYVLAHRAADDVVLLNTSSNWGFAYYWPVGAPGTAPSSAVLQGYLAEFPHQRIVVAASGAEMAIYAALEQAEQGARDRPGARVWLIRTHIGPREALAWQQALARAGLRTTPVQAGLGLVSGD